MKRLLGIVALVCSFAAANAHAQTMTTVTASNIQNGGVPLALGRICFQATDGNNNPIAIRWLGGGQQGLAPFCATVTNGAIVPTFQVPNPQYTVPYNVPYTVRVQDASGNPVLTYLSVQFVGTAFNFDTYTPSNPAPMGYSANYFSFGTGFLTNYLDINGIAAPANPGSGFGRLYFNSGTQLLACVTSSGANCAPSGGGGATLETNGTNNASQTVLNIQNGTGTTASNPSGGNVQVNVTYGTSANTAAQGNDPRITGAAPAASPTFTGTVTMPAPTLNNVTGSTQCLHVNASGLISGTGSDCGAGGGGSGTVNSGSQWQLGYYGAAGAAISGSSIYTNSSGWLGVLTGAGGSSVDSPVKIGTNSSATFIGLVPAGYVAALNVNDTFTTGQYPFSFIDATVFTNTHGGLNNTITGSFFSALQQNVSNTKVEAFVSQGEVGGNSTIPSWNDFSCAPTVNAGSAITRRNCVAAGQSLGSGSFGTMVGFYCDGTMGSSTFCVVSDSPANNYLAGNLAVHNAGTPSDPLDVNSGSNLFSISTTGTPTWTSGKSTTGTRYVCINTSGTFVSLASACSGT